MSPYTYDIQRRNVISLKYSTMPVMELEMTHRTVAKQTKSRRHSWQLRTTHIILRLFSLLKPKTIIFI